MDFWKQKQVGSFLFASRPKDNFKYYGSGRIKAIFYEYLCVDAVTALS